MIEPHADVRGYFRERLLGALERHRLSIDSGTEFYLVNLLSEFAISPPLPTLERPLAEQLADALETEGYERLRRFRGLGDAALYVSGFFADHLERRGITADYAGAMGDAPIAARPRSFASRRRVRPRWRTSTTSSRPSSARTSTCSATFARQLRRARPKISCGSTSAGSRLAPPRSPTSFAPSASSPSSKPRRAGEARCTDASTRKRRSAHLVGSSSFCSAMNSTTASRTGRP